MILTLSLLKDGEAQDVFDSIQKLACVSKYYSRKKKRNMNTEMLTIT